MYANNCIGITERIGEISVFVFGNREKTIVNKPVSSVLTSKPRLEDDFYDYVNYQYLSSNQINDEEKYWYFTLTDSENKIKDEKKEIIKSILNNCDKYEKDSINSKICIFSVAYGHFFCEKVCISVFRRQYINIIDIIRQNF